MSTISQTYQKCSLTRSIVHMADCVLKCVKQQFTSDVLSLKFDADVAQTVTYGYIWENLLLKVQTDRYILERPMLIDQLFLKEGFEIANFFISKFF